VGRCWCVEGKRWRLTLGARISAGRVLYSIVGRRGDSVRRAVAIRVVSGSVHNDRDVIGVRELTLSELQYALIWWLVFILWALV
jgi:hypothetical protein